MANSLVGSLQRLLRRSLDGLGFGWLDVWIVIGKLYISFPFSERKKNQFNKIQQCTPRNYLRNLIKSTRKQIVFTIFRLIWIQTDVRLDPNQSENGKYNLISGWYNKIREAKLKKNNQRLLDRFLFIQAFQIFKNIYL